MNLKRLLFTGAAVAAVAKFFAHLGNKPALIVGAAAVIAVALSDNIIPD